MSIEHLILYIAGALLLSITAGRFLVQELISLVKLVKQLKAEMRAPLPPMQQSVAVTETHSKKVHG